MNDRGIIGLYKKPIIHLKEKGVEILFDIKTIRIFENDLTDIQNIESIREILEQTINSFSIKEEVN